MKTKNRSAYELILLMDNQIRAVDENIGFIISELHGLSVPEETKANLLPQLHSCEANVLAMKDEKRHLLHSAGFADDSAWYDADGRHSLELMDENLQQCVDKLKSLVSQVSILPDEQFGVLTVLMTESATNVLNASSEFLDYSAKLRPKIPPPLPGIVGPPRNTINITRSLYRCSICTALAAAVSLIPSISTNPASPQDDSVFLTVIGILYVSREIKGDNPISQARAAIISANPSRLYKMDQEFVPFYCPYCMATYCTHHLRVEDVEDDGFYDATYATCPKGHRRMIMD